MKLYNVIGVMSGTSLDGIDLCYCQFTYSDSWNFKILASHTYSIPPAIKSQLKDILQVSGLSLSLLNNEFGDLIGTLTNEFIDQYKIQNVDFISSHGHTIFHQPEKNLTLQTGNGANITSKTNLPVVCDFRTVDLSLKGNGAPLVPIGDELLFKDYDCCLNIGGIANISFKKNNNRVAYDICPANMVLNHLANKLELEYDHAGEKAKSGNLIPELFDQLNELKYYKTSFPKSLGYEWVKNEFIPLLEGDTIDLLHTSVEHIAYQIAANIKGKTLITGGGAFNTHLIDRIKFHSKHEIIIPEESIVNFKEALIFGLLGVLRWRAENNVLSSVTGAKSDNIGGCIYLPPNFS